MSRTLSTINIGASASVALISPNTAAGMGANGVLKVVNLPPWTPGKFIYVADKDGTADYFPFGISGNEPNSSTIIAGTIPWDLDYLNANSTIVGAQPSTFYGVINKRYGAMGFVAGGSPYTGGLVPTQIWYTVINEGGVNYYANLFSFSTYSQYISTNSLDVGTINTQNLNFVGGGSVTMRVVARVELSEVAW